MLLSGHLALSLGHLQSFNCELLRAGHALRHSCLFCAIKLPEHDNTKLGVGANAYLGENVNSIPAFLRFFTCCVENSINISVT